MPEAGTFLWCEWQRGGWGAYVVSRVAHNKGRPHWGCWQKGLVYLGGVTCE